MAPSQLPCLVGCVFRAEAFCSVCGGNRFVTLRGVGYLFWFAGDRVAINSQNDEGCVISSVTCEACGSVHQSRIVLNWESAEAPEVRMGSVAP